MERRKFIQWMGIMSGAAASGMDLAQASSQLYSRVRQSPEGILPGEPQVFRTTCTECPAGCGLLVTMRDGHPVKLEGMPGHPVNHGALCLRGQASITRLYHPERLVQPLQKTSAGRLEPVSWDEALRTIRQKMQSVPAAGRFWLGSATSGSFSRVVEEFCQVTLTNRLPEVETFHHGALRWACRQLFGRPSVPAFRLDRCDLLITLGADLLDTYLSPVEQTAQLAAAAGQPGFAWYHAEPHLSLTGCRAGIRLPLRPGTEAVLIACLLQQLRPVNPLPVELLAAAGVPLAAGAIRVTGLDPGIVEKLTDAVRRAKRPLLLAGGAATAQTGGARTALLAGLFQYAAGSLPEQVDFSRSLTGNPGNRQDWAALADRWKAQPPGLVFLAGLHSLAAAPELEEPLRQAGCRVALTDFVYPAMDDCDFYLPVSHSLESWGDHEPRRGLRCLIKPVFHPLKDTRPSGGILLDLMQASAGWKEYLFKRWEGYGKPWWEKGWTTYDTPAAEIVFDPVAVRAALRQTRPAEPAALPALVLAPTVRGYDGRSRVLPLLHEIPDPVSTVSYGEPLLVPPATGQKLQLSEGSRVMVKTPAGQVETVVHLQEGLPEDIVQLALDHAEPLTLPAAPLTGESVRVLAGITITLLGHEEKLPVLSGSVHAEGRGILPGDPPPHHGGAPVATTMYPEHPHQDYRWGMAIDLDRCTGCSACVAACYLENNIPLTSREDHQRGREMSWLRLEPFATGGRLLWIPMMCQHCDHAPCENVCPVFATYHNPEGLNVQVYNRCVGTRYCANNCPYKVRRFNWFDHEPAGTLRLLHNPDVSRRSKGIMEKCTFCVHRIRRAKDLAKDEQRLVRDGEVVTACAQTCPAKAITFGNLLDPASAVSKLAVSPRAYRILEAVGTRPAVYYLSDRQAGHALETDGKTRTNAE